MTAEISMTSILGGSFARGATRKMYVDFRWDSLANFEARDDVRSRNLLPSLATKIAIVFVDNPPN